MKTNLSNCLNSVRVDEAHRRTVEHQRVDRSIVKSFATAFECLVFQRSLQHSLLKHIFIHEEQRRCELDDLDARNLLYRSVLVDIQIDFSVRQLTK